MVIGAEKAGITGRVYIAFVTLSDEFNSEALSISSHFYNRECISLSFEYGASDSDFKHRRIASNMDDESGAEGEDEIHPKAIEPLHATTTTL